MKQNKQIKRQKFHYKAGALQCADVSFDIRMLIERCNNKQASSLPC